MSNELPKSGQKRITLSDVAELAGVSVQTASHVMAENLSVRLPETTRNRVKEAAKTLGYQPNRMAQAMKTGKSNIVSLWMPVDRPSFFFLRTLKEFNRRCRAERYDLMIVGLESSQAYGEETRLPHQWPVDGVIAVDAGRAMKTWRNIPGNEKTPLVVLGAELFSYADNVAWDVKGAFYEATRRFASQGCKKIVHITPSWVIAKYPNEQRRSGYSLAMQEAGLEPVFIETQEESSGASALALESYIQEYGVPDAVVAFTDTFAIGAIRALENNKVAIPMECQVCGYGDFPEAEDFGIPITTICPPIEKMTERAWSWLSERIQNPSLDSRSMTFDMEIITRKSTREDF